MNPKHIKIVVWLVWAAVFLSGHHWLLALYFLPTAVAVSRQHRHPHLVAILNLVFGWTPAWLLVLLYSLEKPDDPFRVVSRRKLRHSFPPVKVNVVETPRTKRNTIII